MAQFERSSSYLGFRNHSLKKSIDKDWLSSIFLRNYFHVWYPNPTLLTTLETIFIEPFLFFPDQYVRIYTRPSKRLRLWPPVSAIHLFYIHRQHQYIYLNSRGWCRRWSTFSYGVVKLQKRKTSKKNTTSLSHGKAWRFFSSFFLEKKFRKIRNVIVTWFFNSGVITNIKGWIIGCIVISCCLCR